MVHDGISPKRHVDGVSDAFPTRDSSCVYSHDDLLARGICALRDATMLLGDVALSLDRDEPIRHRMEEQLRTLDGVLDELDHILDDARDEVL